MNILEEMQLWMHPFPPVIGVKKVSDSDSRFVSVSELFEERRRTPPQLKRCVTAVAKKDGDTSRAFAICTSSLQRKGYLKPGSKEPTKKGMKAGRSKAADLTHAKKLSDYEQLLAFARKNK